jgi:hypothetical protein
MSALSLSSIFRGERKILLHSFQFTKELETSSIKIPSEIQQKRENKTYIKRENCWPKAFTLYQR